MRESSPRAETDDSATEDASGKSRRDAWQATRYGTFVHLFEWPWADVATECEEFLGPAGFSAVQVSPPNENAVIPRRPWWERYQPVSYKIGTRGGDEGAFADMIARCDAVGVHIYVDAILNHMSAQSGGTGTAGTAFSRYNYGDVWAPGDFHTPACGIEASDYQNAPHAVRTCELVGLPDLNTSLEHVQEQLADYLAHLIDLGVAGFRIDAAKHMAPEDLEGIFKQLEVRTQSQPYVFLEVIEGAGEAIGGADFLHLNINDSPVAVTEFRYLGIGDLFRSPLDFGDLTGFTPDAWGLLPSERAVVFTDNHDTQRHGTNSFLDGLDHRLANIFLLAHPYGYPKLMSSFDFTPESGRDTGPPMDRDGAIVGPHHPDSPGCVVTGESPFDPAKTQGLEDGLWVCEHRDPALVSMVNFRRHARDAPVIGLTSDGSETLAFARERRGFVAFNRGDEPWDREFNTTLPAGEYCEIFAHGNQNDCDEDTITVDTEGLAAVTVQPGSALVIQTHP